MSIVASLIGPVSGILDKVIPDADEKAKLAHQLATMADTHAQQALLAQLEINKAEAASGAGPQMHAFSESNRMERIQRGGA